MKRLIGAALLSVSAATAQADIFHNESGSIIGGLCVGIDCAVSEVFLSNVLSLKFTVTDILFEDTSSASFPSNDWALNINDGTSIAGGGRNHFSIRDVTAGWDPFRIEAGAPVNSLYVADDGHIGMGTSLPQKDLHLSSSATSIGPVIRLEETGSFPGAWDIQANHFNFFVRDVDSNAIPFLVRVGAPSSSLHVSGGGRVGLGTSSPQGKLHTRGSGVQLAYFESSDGGPVQVRFRTNSENRRFLAVNNADEVQSQIIFGDDEIKFTGETDSGANLWLSIGASGIISQGPTCGSPCDLTFDPDHFTVPPIEERAAYMWDNMHLPAIGPTSPGAPINLTEKTGGIIHELEVAHIYIEQLHTAFQQQQTALTALSAEVHALKNK